LMEIQRNNAQLVVQREMRRGILLVYEWELWFNLTVAKSLGSTRFKWQTGSTLSLHFSQIGNYSSVPWGVYSGPRNRGDKLDSIPPSLSPACHSDYQNDNSG
jgi:hypothetical protein